MKNTSKYQNHSTKDQLARTPKREGGVEGSNPKYVNQNRKLKSHSHQHKGGQSNNNSRTEPPEYDAAAGLRTGHTYKVESKSSKKRS